MLEILFFSALAVGIVLFALSEIQRFPRIIIFQWGEFVNSRAGMKNHPTFADEPDVVEYQDFRYWVRVKPNPGVNLPLIGYWSKATGRKRRS